MDQLNHTREQTDNQKPAPVLSVSFDYTACQHAGKILTSNLKFIALDGEAGRKTCLYKREKPMTERHQDWRSRVKMV